MNKQKIRLPSSDEVYHRIDWDENIPSYEITIIWEDRFKGLKEEHFEEFDIHEVPMHRIQQFKHNGKVIWDRKSRLNIITETFYPKSN